MTFVDLNVPSSGLRKEKSDKEHTAEIERLVALLDRCRLLGWETVAINVRHSGGLKVSPDELFGLSRLRSELSRRCSKLTVLSRLTVAVNSVQDTYSISRRTDWFTDIDVVAIEPLNDKVFQHTLGNLLTNIDLICAGLQETPRLPFALKHKAVREVARSGIAFELCFSPFLLDGNSRRNTLTNCLTILRGGRARGFVVFSSRVANPSQARTPYDFITMAHLLGLKSHENARQLVEGNPMSVLRKGCRRRKGYRYVVEPVSESVEKTDGRKMEKRPQKQ
eukprot:Clim_evm213s157 gene=Clim_evmTU213s157